MKPLPSAKRRKISHMPKTPSQDIATHFLSLPNDQWSSSKQRGFGGNYKCYECDRSFHEQWRLRRHQLTHLRQDERPVHYCHVEGCNRKYYQPESLGRHLKSHHSILPKNEEI